jgi:hypothetical protein
MILLSHYRHPSLSSLSFFSSCFKPHALCLTSFTFFYFSPGVKTIADKWEVAYLDLAAGGGGAFALSGLNFAPFGAETVAVSGVGLKAT